MRATPKGVCMYELPTKFNTDIRNSTFNKPVPQPKAIHGLSPLFTGLTDTDQFSLDRIFYDRMKLEATIWLKPEECKLFYVPYFSQHETWSTDRDNGDWVDVDREGLNTEVLSHLTHMGQFRKPSGVDHVIILSRVAQDCEVLLQDPSFMYMKKLGIETTVMTEGDPNLYAIPYPAWFRYGKPLESPAVKPSPSVVVTSAHFDGSKCSGSSALEALEQSCKGKSWCAFHAPAQIQGCNIKGIHGQYKCSGSDKQFSFSATSNDFPMRTGAAAVLGCARGPCWLWGDCQKPIGKERTGPLAVFIGSARAEEHNRIAMIRHCQLRPELCVFFDTAQPGFKLDNHMVTKMDDLLMSSVFCFNPPGDTPTRKGLFDSLLAGCIPVVFDDASLSMYRWHIPNADELSVSIPVQLDKMPAVFNGPTGEFNVLDYLASISPAKIRQKQEAIRRIAFSLQYSEEPTPKDSARHDAFDIAMAGLGV